ncbi:hypothetical protein GQ457_12G019230 [Hibiscus cannabinus]
MSNPSLSSNPSNVVFPSGGGAGLAGDSGFSTSGRPPDRLVIDGVPGVVERLGSPISKGLLPESKRGRRTIEQESYEVHDMVNGNSDDGNDHMDSQRTAGNTLSFKDTLAGTKKPGAESLAITDLDVEVQAEDVRIGGSSVLPEIWFSDRVHDAIDVKLTKFMIIRLMGKPIGYRALWNWIQTLWNPSGEISLIDLDNEYYLVRFASEANFHKVLSGGLWVIYGSYLTVQPWSIHFSTAQDHPSHIMVWVRLPKLPYRYYTKSLFRYIAATIGKVVRVDYNTSEGKRGRFARLAIIVDLNKPLISELVIDGKRQDIEYEGLPSICFTCGKYGHGKERCGVPKETTDKNNSVVEQRNPTELYGPWMQVVNRKRRNTYSPNTTRNLVRSAKPTDKVGSHFAELFETENVIELEDDSLNVGVTEGDMEAQVLRSKAVGNQAGSTSMGDHLRVELQHQQSDCDTCHVTLIVTLIGGRKLKA